MALSQEKIYEDCCRLAEDLGLPQFCKEFGDLGYLLYLLKKLRDVNRHAFQYNFIMPEIWDDLREMGYYYQTDQYMAYRRTHSDLVCSYCFQPVSKTEVIDCDRLLDEFFLEKLLLIQKQVPLLLHFPLHPSQFQYVHYLPALYICRNNLCRKYLQRF